MNTIFFDLNSDWLKMFSIGSSIELCMKWCLDHSFRMVVVLKYWIYVCVGDEKKPVHFHFILKLEPLLLSLFCSRSNSNSQFESNFWSNNWPEKWWSKLKNSFFKKFHKIFFFVSSYIITVMMIWSYGHHHHHHH